ncbi:MAG: antibiotic biosynthesis monooxygenase, partial [Deltaproteobacteria bacterium]|nr:antibiotic biosynthesis monooxygenase [Deltaproteobacteria bacterium]
MISVIASIRMKAGKRSEFLEIFKANVPKVREEKGCIEYFPAVDVDSGLPPQSLNENVV